MKAIWKFNVGGVVQAPRYAAWLDAQMQDGVLVAWAVVTPGDDLVSWQLSALQTGEVDDTLPGDYVGTAQSTAFVWHVFAQVVPA